MASASLPHVRVGPTTSASTRINSRSRTKELESLVINDQRRANQGLCTNAREPDGASGVPLVEVTDRLERCIVRGAITDDAGCDDLRAPSLGPNDVDQADELIGVSRADLRPRVRLGFDGNRGGLYATGLTMRCVESRFA